MLASDPAWFHDARVLFLRPTEFWPARDHTPEERLNSMVRFVLYACLATALYTRKPKYILFGVVAVTLLSVAYSTCTPSPRWREPWKGRRPGIAAGVAPGDGVSDTGATTSSSCQRAPFGAAPGQPPCTMSTPNNPFANVLLTDLADNPARPPACKYDDQKDLIRDNFNRGLVRNVFDVYERENSQRQFVTMPVTTSTPDTVAFAQFCYGNMGRPTCKEDPSRCTGSRP